MQAGDAPVLIRIETRAGHGAGKPTSKLIEEIADQWGVPGESARYATCQLTLMGCWFLSVLMLHRPHRLMDDRKR
jgi:hypothetical protein